MKTRTKVQYVPTVLLDSVLAIKVKQHEQKKQRINIVSPTSSRKVVIYKMISTEEWKKKEDARIATEAKLKASREKPKSEASIYTMSKDLGLFKRTPKSRNEKRLQYNEYYFLNKERLQLAQAKYRQRCKDQLIVRKPKIPPTDANA